VKRDPPSRLPLNALLSALLAELTHEFVVAAEGLAYPPRYTIEAVLATCSNLLWHLGDDTVSQRDLRVRARVSKRALRFAVDQATRSRWVALESGDRASAQHVRLTPSGRSVADSCADHLGVAERSWRARVDDDRASALLRSLEQLVRKLDLELPHYPVGYGPADHGVTGGGALWGRGTLSYDPEAEQRAADRREDESGGRLDVRHHGQDWSPVPRDDGDAVEGLSLTALTSEALMAFTIDYEGSGGLSLAYVADLLRHIGDEGVDIQLRPARGAGATGELPVHWAFATLTRHWYAAVEPEPTARRRGTLRLTEKGRQVRDAYPHVAAAIEKRWERRYGTSIVRSLRSALASVVGGIDIDSPHHALSLSTGLNKLLG
jgi:DNA-binding MarR family transcriptional regulator